MIQRYGLSEEDMSLTMKSFVPENMIARSVQLQPLSSIEKYQQFCPNNSALHLTPIPVKCPRISI